MRTPAHIGESDRFAGESPRYVFFSLREEHADEMFNGVANVPICASRSTRARVYSRHAMGGAHK